MKEVLKKDLKAVRRRFTVYPENAEHQELLDLLQSSKEPGFDVLVKHYNDSKELKILKSKYKEIE